MTDLLGYIDLFLLKCSKRSNYASNSFKIPWNSSSKHYAQNYSGIIPTP